MRRDHGFTLVELLVVLVLTGILASALQLSISSTVQWGDSVQEHSVLHTEARSALDRLAADLRQAYSGSSVSPIETMTPTVLTFDSPDRATPFHLRRITYRLASGELDRAVAVSTNTNGPPWTYGPQGPWTDQVGSIVVSTIFTYFDANGAATATPAAVRSVGLAVGVATPQAPSRVFAYTTNVTLRETQ